MKIFLNKYAIYFLKNNFKRLYTLGVGQKIVLNVIESIHMILTRKINDPEILIPSHERHMNTPTEKLLKLNK